MQFNLHTLVLLVETAFFLVATAFFVVFSLFSSSEAEDSDWVSRLLEALLLDLDVLDVWLELLVFDFEPEAVATFDDVVISRVFLVGAVAQCVELKFRWCFCVKAHAQKSIYDKSLD
jgi:hypothetical protein